jgi:O-methyltransferase
MMGPIKRFIFSKVMFWPRKLISVPLTGTLGLVGLTISTRADSEPMNIEKADMLRRIVPWISNVNGDIAEAGVYRGFSAKIICEGKKDKSVHLFDTFAGLPEPGEFDSPILKQGNFKASLDTLEKDFSVYSNVKFYKGLMSDTIKLVPTIKFCFVHLDVDLYESTLDGLRYFYNNMKTGGVILGHDYPRFSGVKKAFDEFFEDKPEHILQISRNYAFILKK